MSAPADSPDSIAISSFWRWFANHEAALRTGGNEALDQVERELHKVDPRLGLEMSEPGHKREMIVTAWSEAAAFGAVRALVAAAPPLASWQIVALKPPRGFKFAIDLDGLHVNADVLKFDPLHSPQAPGALGIMIHVTGAAPTDPRWQRALPLIIETGIGEEAAAEIFHIEPSAEPPDEKSLAIHHLLEYVQWHRRRHGRG
jgi:hypothetical protein